MKSSFLFAYTLAAGSLLGACGGSGGETGGDGGRSEAGTDTGKAHEGGVHSEAGGDGPTTNKYPAFPVDYPQVNKNNGAVLTSPVVVTITWPQDTNASSWDGFGDAIGNSSYWTAATAEYGVGKATSGATNHVHMLRRLPSVMSYYNVANFVAEALGGVPADAGASEGGSPDGGAVDSGPPDPMWPLPTTDAMGNVQTIYSLFIPQTTSVFDPGSMQSFCSEGSNGYHDDAIVAGKIIPYSIVLECPSQSVPLTEEAASHEYVEAATDPYVDTGMLTPDFGYIGFDPNHLAWDLYTGFQDELGDACQAWQDSYFLDTAPFPYWVQRTWSNRAALLGKDPCVPAPAAPYYGVTTFSSQKTKVTVDLSMAGMSKATTLGFNVRVGQPTSFDVGFFSEAPVAAWTISYDVPSLLMLYDTKGFPISNGTATVTINKTTGKNGDKATVTVTPTKAGPAGFQVMAITWDPATMAGYPPHYLPIVLVDQ